nr:type IV secretory system conjugative DNA transfer family protein [Lachnospiraceae bacterium]
NVMISAIEQGHGLTFFDPHGSTIDVLLRSLPEKYADRIRVVRIGDTDNPVPLNIWDSDDPAKEERNISDLCELFADIFDPKREGFVGPRYERWLSTFAKASIAVLGRRASLESIAVISQSQDNMLKVYKAIVDKYPDLAERIKQEYGLDRGSEFHSTLNWYLSKFERLTSVEQLRKTLGAGTNALDFAGTIDTDTVTLIDLASPRIGTHAARIIGTLLLMKLWNAAMERKDRDRLHMVVVDEASLFQTNPMPRMLAESRKFGLSMILCHQHASQLSREILDALEANSASFSAFRLSPKDASNAAIRLDDPKMQTDLTRLDAFRAVTTLSVDGKQTAPFTLEISCPKKQKNAEELAEKIEKASISRLVEPYRSLRALTPAEIMKRVEEPELKLKNEQYTELSEETVPKETEARPDFLDVWKKKRDSLKTA